MRRLNSIRLIIAISILIGISTLVGLAPKLKNNPTSSTVRFNSNRAMADVNYQVSLGPRIPGSQSHEMVIEWISSLLLASNWELQVQQTNSSGNSITNIVGKIGKGRPWVVISAHYDSRLQADQDLNPKNQSLPVPGANDGASGVSVLLELARILPEMYNEGKLKPATIWLVFFDAEDNGNIPGWDWILGSRAFVRSLSEYPDIVVNVDMVGDVDLNIYQDRNSDAALNNEIWSIADELGYGEFFIPELKYTIIDDHVPFREVGVRAVDIIDFDYPYWHTTNDLTDKLSPKSMQIVGETLIAWLMNDNE